MGGNKISTKDINSYKETKKGHFVLIKNGLNTEIQLLIKLYNTILCFQKCDLLFIEAHRSYSFLHIEGREKIKISKSMKWLIDKIEEGLLIKCHKSFAVNSSKIQSVDLDNRKITLTNGITVPISCGELPKFKK